MNAVYKQPLSQRFYLNRFLLLFASLVYTVGLFAQSSVDHKKIITNFFNKQAQVKYIARVQLNPAGTQLLWQMEESDGGEGIYLAPFNQLEQAKKISAFAAGNHGHETEPKWSPDGSEIAFLSEAATPGQLQLFIADGVTGTIARKAVLTNFDGYVSHVKWSPDGKYVSVLYVEKSSREPSPMAAKNRTTGVIDSLANTNIQSLMIIEKGTGTVQKISPPQLYVFEYDWSPDSKQIAYTAAAPPGDDNWYIAQLYRQQLLADDAQIIYKPKRQIALPRWSPGGKRIAFIEGLMSDQGGTGGEIFSVSATGKGPLINYTPGRKSTPSWFMWQPDGNMLFNEFTGGSVAVNRLNTSTKKTELVWKADASARAGSEEMCLSVAGDNNASVVAFISSSWNRLPEIWGGPLGKPVQLTTFNKANETAMPVAENITWKNEGFNVQGWLLYPENYDAHKKYPMMVCVHGGPAWITTPTWYAPDFNTTVYTKLGYFVFFPNPRGSHGQGLQFTLANRRDWGFGDLRDIVSGVDAVLKKYPVETKRVGMLGWSYGGSMAMFAGTQTKRFAAAVAGAGAADWLSYYGQNSIDKWMQGYFGASPYDDPAAYAKVSAMTYIKKASTPTLVLVGELDGEAPSPQSFQFWHALKELHVPTQLVVYPDEGHSFEKQENKIDITVRTFEWFEKYMKSEVRQGLLEAE